MKSTHNLYLIVVVEIQNIYIYIKKKTETISKKKHYLYIINLYFIFKIL